MHLKMVDWVRQCHTIEIRVESNEEEKKLTERRKGWKSNAHEDCLCAETTTQKTRKNKTSQFCHCINAPTSVLYGNED